MARNFLDTSGLIKLYRTEPETPAVQACITPQDDLLASALEEHALSPLDAFITSDAVLINVARA